MNVLVGTRLGAERRGPTRAIPLHAFAAEQLLRSRGVSRSVERLIPPAVA